MRAFFYHATDSAGAVELRRDRKSAIQKEMFLSFDSLREIANLRHAVTTRDGGVSQAEYSALNLAFHVGDDENHVRENRVLLADALDYDGSTLVAAQQVHGSDSQIVTPEYSGRGALDLESAIPDCDALITQTPNLPVLIQVADCAPILLVDPRQKVLAAVHAGWRGAVGNVAGKTLRKMSATFGTRPEDVLVGIGPCLCAECFEVGEEVAAQAPENCVVRGAEKPHLDLRVLIAQDCIGAGVLQSHIEVMNRCPRCETETFFSHRGQNGTAGRFGLVAWWE